MDRRISAIILTLSLLASSPAIAGEILLKSGEKIKGDVVEEDDRYVKINVKGAIIPYHNFEVDKIDGKGLEAVKNSYSDKTLQLLIKSEIPPAKAGATDVVTPEEYLERGVAFYGKGELDYAMSNLTSAIKIKPDYIEAYIYRGGVYMDKNDTDKAIADYNKAIEINPKSEEAYFVRGRAYFAKGDADKAIADYNKAIEINPKYAQAYLNRALVDMTKGNTEQAISDANKVIDINPNVAVSYYIRGLAYANGDNMDNAIAEYTKAIKLKPDYIEAYANRSLAYAYSIIEKSRRDPNAPNTYINIGISVLDKVGFDKAIADCNKVIELSPKYAEAYLTRARIYLLANDFDKAWADLHKAEEIGGKVKPEFLEELENLSGRKR